MSKPLTLIATMSAKPGKTDELKNTLLSLIQPTRAEQGCICYDFHQNTDQPEEFMFYEQWSDKAALDQHLETSHIKSFISKIPELLATELNLSQWEKIQA